MNAREVHDHYAKNAKAYGHDEKCEKVTAWVNWPTILGRPTCTCGLDARLSAQVERLNQVTR